MKKLLLIFLFSSLVGMSYGQTLFTYGKKAVDADEFLTAFNKNRVASADSSNALRNYLDLYIIFKLKVQAAKDLKLDTLASMQADLQNFRSQIEGNYLDDEKEVKYLVNQAFERSQKDIHVVYYFLKNNQTADSLNQKKAIEKFAKKLLGNEAADAKLLDEINFQKTNKIQKNDAGFITVFSLPYVLENIVYSLKPGESSLPLATHKGWYVFKNTGERKAVGKITVAQILFAAPDDAPAQRSAAKKLADSVYHLLQNGGDFSELAKEFSDDKNTYMTGGLIPAFGTGKWDNDFENHAFALTKDNEISQPFETKFGYHILKRISAEPVPDSQNDEAYIYDLKQEVLKDNRNEIAKQKFFREILPIIGFQKKSYSEQNLWKFTDSVLMSNKRLHIGNIQQNTTLFSFNNHKNITAADWITYLQSARDVYPGMPGSYQKHFEDFTRACAFSNYASRLENYNVSFKKQLDEFKEGNLLFEVMQQKVWNKASSDTIGLKKYYREHKSKYVWSSSADAVIFSCSNKNVAHDVIAMLKKGKTWKDVLNQFPTQLQADSGRFELGQIPVIERTMFSNGLITAPVINKNDGTAVFAKIVTVYPDQQPRKFQDARGLVINDYQNYLEENWVKKLKAKYPIRINDKVLDSLNHITVSKR